MYFKQFRRPLKFSFTIIIGIIIFNILTAAPTNTPQTSDRIKGVWLSHVGNSLLTYTSAIDNVFYRLSQQNYNTVYVDVYNGGTTYPSKYSSRNKLISFPFTDPLQTAIKEGKRQGLHIYAWYEHGMMLFPKQKLAQQHPDWILTTSDGKQYIEKHLWLDPEKIEVQQYFVNLFTEVAQKYPELYGIQVDDHFGFPYDFGYDEYTVKLYQQEHNGKLPPKPPANIKTASSCIVQNQEWIEWTRWRADKVTNYLKQVFSAIKDNNADAIVSVSPNPQTFSLNCYLADWQKWERMGLVEELVLQVYRNDMNAFRRELSQPEVKAAKQHIPFGIGVLSGLKGRPIAFEQIKTQVETVRQEQFAGVSFFFYESLWNLASESPEQRQSALRSLFASPLKRVSL
ncbi:MAG: family 10 glycosylhydrolase [Hyellaceae cyanobacterium CSU_1_1]|nr:family 10 glycosylhydrolase [Hyellaceae cyanobacterium CSU_1_1]